MLNTRGEKKKAHTHIKRKINELTKKNSVEERENRK